ncbi:NAD(P)/FAD-dependent oxidoreductase [Hartmannibacter diazotrophicus]|nr:NAD(P)/FAD-dependent oxidoreductase [Hartmannibacter diazotrophicus]
MPDVPAPVGGERPRVVILGAGFGGLNAAMALADAPVDITIVDRRNHHLFQPLLYQVATAGLSPAQIATPIRRVLAAQKNVTVLMETARAIDPKLRTVTTCTREIDYDYLIVAMGARHAYFGHDEWEKTAPGLKTIADATDIRARILTAFEKAEARQDPAGRAALMTFIVVGGGPTGVEMSGAIAELARQAIVRDFRNISPETARIVLVEAGPRLLPSFPETLSAAAARQLEKIGVEVRLGASVIACDEGGVTLAGDARIDAATVLWCAGVMASPAASWLAVPSDRAGRVIVNPDLSVPQYPEIFVIGDTAAVLAADGRPVPGVAPAAKQMGRHAAVAIRSKLAGWPSQPFRYRDFGNLATIGRKAAVADLGRIRLSGFAAWLLWSLAHLWFLVGYRNRLVVFLDWAFAYIAFERGARLITERSER